MAVAAGNVPRCLEAVYQVLAVSPSFHQDGIVLAGTETNGLFRSTDKGHTFSQVDGAPQQVNALAASDAGWFLSDERGVWKSSDGLIWEAVADSSPVLVLAASNEGMLAGGENGLTLLGLARLALT